MFANTYNLRISLEGHIRQGTLTHHMAGMGTEDRYFSFFRGGDPRPDGGYYKNRDDGKFHPVQQ
jgi:hypothetical protein